ncbi:MAG: XAC2610-related protein [Bacteroidales bacterium]
MRKLLIFTFIISLFIILSCKQKEASISKDQLNHKSLKKSLLDSLIQYSNLTEALLIDDSLSFSIIITKANDKKIAAIAIAFQSLYLYEMEKNTWIQIDSIPLESYAKRITVEDINNDKFEDIIISLHPDLWGNIYSNVFLAIKTGKYKYRKDIDLCNLQYDKNLNLIKSFEGGGCYAYRCKEYYHWQRDSLKLLRGVEINPDQTDNDIVRFYTLMNHEKHIYKVIKDNGCVYDTALWTGYY